jgi:diguanylate cyclase (GGDEF)-like protein
MSTGQDGSGDAPRDPSGLAMTLAPDTTLSGLSVPAVVDRSEATSGSLIVIAGAPADVGTHVLVGDEVVIGRVGEGLQLRDGRTSRRHVRVWCSDGAYQVEDMGSTNGTALNGRRLEAPTPLHDGDKIYLGSTVLKFTLVDETEAAYLARMARLAGTDPLTGLHAKHRFDSMLDEALRIARSTGTPLVVRMMDMDGLKRINDAHGHQHGAHTIATVGARIGALLGGRGEACRFGGDEFCAYLPGVDLQAALELADELRRIVEGGEYELEGVVVRATISIGVAAASPDRPSREMLVAAADRALYRAKGKGRNCVSD